MRPVPRFLYGTAWKEDRTEALVRLALEAGFRGIDTANQRRHYFEAAVGAAVGRARRRGQGPARGPLPADEVHVPRRPGPPASLRPAAPIPRRRSQQSFASSLEHLRTTYVDSYVLHGPSPRRGLTDEDWAVWRAMEAVHAGRPGAPARRQQRLARAARDAASTAARVKPAFVQNRCYAIDGWDADVRAFCARARDRLPGLLAAHRERSARSRLRPCSRAAQRTGRTAAQVVFRFALQVGMIPLTGTVQPRPHAGGPGRPRLRAGAGGGARDREVRAS